MSRLAGTGELTLDMLAEEVPLFQQGKAAAAELAAGGVHHKRRPVLARTVADGQAAQERLVLAALPLIKHLASKEHARRQRWASQVSFDDLFQEAVAGFLRGLAAYNPDGGQRSATNYLGQWIMIEMRRNVEAVDNDFGVAFDAAERMRKIRALRSRLAAELEREPTDEEIVAASLDPAYAAGQKMGRVNKTGPRKGLTLAQLAEERDFRARVGATHRLGDPVGDEADLTVVEFARPLSGDSGADAADTVVAAGASAGLAKVVEEAVTAMGLPAAQREIIARRFGLAPFGGEESARDISKEMGLQRVKVSKVIEAFTTEMTRPGGAFHRACAALSGEELCDLGLGWVQATLGAVPAGAAPVPVPPILTEPLRAGTGAVPPPPPPVPGSSRAGVRAQFSCPVHVNGFVGMYPRRDAVPPTRACPMCGVDARLLRVMELVS